MDAMNPPGNPPRLPIDVDPRLDKRVAKRVRRYAGATGKPWPINVRAGSIAPPQLAGEAGYYTTPGGKPITHPNAYHWPKLYHVSTREVEVGDWWLVALAEFADGTPLAVISDRAGELAGEVPEPCQLG
jgi:hypothetical protein